MVGADTPVSGNLGTCLAYALVANTFETFFEVVGASMVITDIHRSLALAQRTNSTGRKPGCLVRITSRSWYAKRVCQHPGLRLRFDLSETTMGFMPIICRSSDTYWKRQLLRTYLPMTCLLCTTGSNARCFHIYIPMHDSLTLASCSSIWKSRTTTPTESYLSDRNPTHTNAWSILWQKELLTSGLRPTRRRHNIHDRLSHRQQVFVQRVCRSI